MSVTMKERPLKRTAGDIGTFAEKVTPVSADMMLIEDSAAAGAKKKVQVGNLPGGTPSAHKTSHEDLGSDEIQLTTGYASAAGTVAIGDSLEEAIEKLDGTEAAHEADAANPHAVTKAQVGLTNVTDDSQLKRADGDINSFGDKAGALVDGDILLGEDSGATYGKIRVLLSKLWTYIAGKVSAIYATQELDNLGVTAINADLLPSGDNLRDLGTAGNKFKMMYTNDLTFEDHNVRDTSLQELARHEINLLDELGAEKFEVTHSIATGIMTVTLTQPSARNLKFVINAKMLEYSGSTMAVNIESFAGTDLIPKDVYVYVQENAGTPELVGSNTSPDGVIEHVDACYYRLGAVSGSVATIYGAKNVKAHSYEVNEHMLDRLVSFGGYFASGMGLTASADTFSVAAGESWHAIRKATVSAITVDRVTPTDYQFIEYNDGQTALQRQDFQVAYADKSAMVAGEYMNISVFSVNNNPDLGGSRLLFLTQDSSSTYTDAKKAWQDKDGMKRVRPVNKTIADCAQPIATIIVYYDGATYTLAAHYILTAQYYLDATGGFRVGNTGGGSTLQNIYESFTGDTGSSVASIPTDSMAIVGGAGITTTVTNDQISVAGDDAATTTKGVASFASTDFNVTAGAVSLKAPRRYQMVIVIDGSGSVITAGVLKGQTRSPYTGTLKKVYMYADVAGTCTVDLWISDHANYPPVVAGSMVSTGTKPNLTGPTDKYEDVTLTNWNPNIVIGDLIKAKIEAATGITHLEIFMEMEVTG